MIVKDAVEQSGRVDVVRLAGRLHRQTREVRKEIEIVKIPKKTDEKRGRKEVECKE